MAEEFTEGRPEQALKPTVVFECPKAFVIRGEESNDNRQEGVLKNSLKRVPIHSKDQLPNLQSLINDKHWKALGHENWKKHPELDLIAAKLQLKPFDGKSQKEGEVAHAETSPSRGRAEEDKEAAKKKQAEADRLAEVAKKDAEREAASTAAKDSTAKQQEADSKKGKGK